MTKKLIALVGSPNSGKTSLFNALTGAHQRVGNYPGVTVEKKIGEIRNSEEKFDVIDLPGLYSLDTRSLDEKVSKDVIFGKARGVKRPDLLAVVIDSTNIKRSLYIVYELRKLNMPFIIVLNLFDLALKRGLDIDIKAIEEHFDCDVVTASSISIDGVSELEKLLERKTLEMTKPLEPIDKESLKEIRELSFIQNSFKQLDGLLKTAIKKDLLPDSFSEKLDRIVLHPIWGSLIMILSLMIMFQLVFSWASPFTDAIEMGFEYLMGLVNQAIPEETLFNSFINDGILAGIGGVVVFLPQILLLFLFIMFFEDFGYLGRVAFLLDHFMRRLGLPGKAVVPLLSSHACAIPGIMAARTIENENDRLTTMLVAPLTTCSARIPVYTLLIAAFIPDVKVIGPFGLPAIVMFGLYALGIISSFVMAFVLKKTVLTGSPSHLLMELPGYRKPRISHIFRGLWIRTKLFLKKVGKVIIFLTVAVWILVSFPRTESGGPELENSYAARIGKAFSPIFKPLGYDWKLTTALIPSFGAREIMVSTTATVLAIEGEEGEEKFEKSLIETIQSEYSLATIFSLLIWFVFAPQCISTFAILRKESNSWKWTIFMGVYTTALAYFGALITYQVLS